MSVAPAPGIEARFVAFHKRNPHIYAIGEARDRGATKLGIGQLWEVMRWQMHDYRTSDDASSYRLNDHYRSRYARLIERENPALEGIFETRALRSSSTLFADEPDDGQISLFEEGFE